MQPFAPSVVATSLGTTRESVLSATQGPVVDPRYRPDERNALYMSTAEFTRSRAAFLERILQAHPRTDYVILPGGRAVYAKGAAPPDPQPPPPPSFSPPKVAFGDRPFDPIMSGRTQGWKVGR